ncbi:hypothetical protein [Actinoalloteichus hymeniacidonis]|uniref:Uncharacterized protein n=1 Tax=Actinoalloteichus hymeniacidonis TaxID=340345 RepID=A0AAC9HL75_9PSEU|nr:hypothetical protein [Actinoalloteichus hymeniacidonis]AOS60935.1 hypothetical protein TL08_00435 [Actinoalloteichus hymeniacidonis]MBB5911065.1 hypothetical protein [Actinoalloteichus hymeniacidonis]
MGSVYAKKTFEDADEARYDVVYEFDPGWVLILDKNTNRTRPADGGDPPGRPTAAALITRDWLRDGKAPERVVRISC